MAVKHLDREFAAIANMKQADIAQGMMLELRLRLLTRPLRQKPVGCYSVVDNVLDLVKVGRSEVVMSGTQFLTGSTPCLASAI